MITADEARRQTDEMREELNAFRKKYGGDLHPLDDQEAAVCDGAAVLIQFAATTRDPLFLAIAREGLGPILESLPPKRYQGGSDDV